MTVIRVIAAVVDERQLTIYKEGGQTEVILQGDKRLRPILDVITPAILAKKIPVEVDLMEESQVDTTYRDYEKKTGGLTRFFRVLKTAVKDLLTGNQEEGEQPIAPQTLGDIPSANPVVQKAIEDIMSTAQSVSHENFKDDETTQEHSIVAVLETPQGRTIVPEVQNLKNHMRHAVQNDNTKGMEAFLARLGKVIHRRDHTVKDVLRFMERGDLPLADDGDIIAYKVLTTDSQGKVALKSDEFVDCHSRKVVQKVGSFVRQDEKLIDKNRRNECSTGLHIARRGYLGGFSGNVIVMVKIKPEDVVSVPPYDPNKVRVAGYHIVGLIPSSEHDILRRNRPMEGTEALKLLTQAIAGDHIEVMEIVNITEAMGGAFEIIPVEGAKVTETVIKEETKPTAPVQEAEDPKALTADPIEPDAVAKTVKAATQTKAQQAMKLFLAGKFDELAAFKKASKKSWEALGFSGAEEVQIKAALEVAVAQETKPVKVEPKVVVEAKEKAAKPTKVVAATTTSERKPPKMEGNRAEIARQLWDKAVAGEKPAWGHLWMHKKQAKQSWEKLGFTKKEIERINTNKPEWV